MSDQQNQTADSSAHHEPLFDTELSEPRGWHVSVFGEDVVLRNPNGHRRACQPVVQAVLSGIIEVAPPSSHAVGTPEQVALPQDVIEALGALVQISPPALELGQEAPSVAA